MSNPQISQLEAQLAALQEKFNTFEEERQLHHLIQDYPYYHDLCYGKGAGPEQYAQWESLFTPDGVSNLHPIGSHQGRDGKMAWAQSATGRGKGCQITISSARVIFDPSKPTEAAGRAYAHIEMVLDDGTVFAVKGRYTWIFSKVDDAWKVASVTLAPFPEA